MRHVLAIDEGTTGVTAQVLDARQRPVAQAYREIAQSYPKPGWVEQDPKEILETVLAVSHEALQRAGLPSLSGIGITNQRETTVVWDRATGTPVHPAIVWQDRRTAGKCASLARKWQATVRRRTGLVLDPYFSATKLQWILARPGVAAKARAGRLAFGTIDSWLAWNLTGRHVTDPTNASRTMLWDIRKGDWDAELLELFGVHPSMLPEVVPSSADVGTAKAFGAPLSGLCGDQQAALFGQRCTRAGEAKATYGTGCFLLQHTGAAARSSRHGLLTTRAASVDGRPQFALEGAVFTAGAAIQWLRDQLGMLAAAPEVDRLAAEVTDAAGVVLVPAFTGLGAPHWDPQARGAILGLTRGADRRHIARATLEAIAMQSAEVLWAMEKGSGVRVPRLRVDGGAARSGLLLQIQADLLQRPVVRPANVATTGLGAGLLAGLATGAWGMADIRAAPADDTVVRPKAPRSGVAPRVAAWRKAVAAVREFKP